MRTILLLIACTISWQIFSQTTLEKRQFIIPEQVVVKEINYKGKNALFIENGLREKGGACLLTDSNFKNGVIEVEIASDIFTGIIFRADSHKKGECVYFRSFNSGTKKHKKTVQYVAKGTKYTWNYLRQNFPGKYESGANIKKNEWFHVKLVVKDKTVKAYVNNSSEPILTVNDMKLGDKSGSVGLWTWKGYFANLKIMAE